MKFIVNKEEIYPVIARVAKAVPQKPTEASMAAILIEFENLDNVITATASAFDGENAITGSFKVLEGEDLSSLRPSGMALFDIVKDLPDGKVEFELASGQISIKAGRGKFKIPQLGIGASLASSLTKPTKKVVLKGEDLAQAISMISAAVSKNNTLPVLASMRIESHQDKIRFVGTDRYRLATIDITAKREFTEDASMLVPLRTIMEIGRSNAKANIVEIYFGETLGMIRAGNVEHIFRLTAGDFPKYDALLSTPSVATAKFNAEELAQVLKRVSKFNNESVKLTVSVDGIVLENSASENGEGIDEANVEYQGEESFSSSFNPNYLADALNQLSGITELAFIAPNRPMTFISVGMPNYTHLVMPVNR